MKTLKVTSILAGFLCSVVASSEMYMPVTILSTADDLVGGRLLYAIKKEIEDSKSLYISYDDEFSVGLSIVTMDGDSRNPGINTLYSEVILWHIPNQKSLYASSSVGSCGANRVNYCAQGIVADIHEEAEYLYRLTKLNQADTSQP